MPIPARYPTRSEGGPIPTRQQIVQKEYPVIYGPEYCDGGRDSFIVSTTPKLIVWEFVYEDLDSYEADILDEHNDSAYDTHLAFDFVDPDTGILWTGVKYLEYQRGTREKVWISKRVVRLVKRP